MKIVFKILKILGTHFVHFGHRIGPIGMELNKTKPHNIKNLSNLKPNTQD